MITVLEELCRRNGLVIALSGRDEISLEPLIAFSSRYISNPKYSKLIIQVTQKILDLYASVLGHSEAIDEYVIIVVLFVFIVIVFLLLLLLLLIFCCDYLFYLLVLILIVVFLFYYVHNYLIIITLIIIFCCYNKVICEVT